jgi:hypothetical protein
MRLVRRAFVESIIVWLIGKGRLDRIHIHVHFCEWVSLHIYRSVNVAAASLGVERFSLLYVAVCAVRPEPSLLGFHLRCSKIFWTSLNCPLVVEK